jgi:hypothetical protein
MDLFVSAHIDPDCREREKEKLRKKLATAKASGAVAGLGPGGKGGAAAPGVSTMALLETFADPNLKV